MLIVSESFELGSECDETVDGEVVLNLIDMMAGMVCSRWGIMSVCQNNQREKKSFKIPIS